MESTTMLSIKDFSAFTGINETTLRYYDKIGLLSPSRRGENRYRYYLPFQVITVNFIKVLVKLGVPLSIIKTMNKLRSPQDMLVLLAAQEAKLDRRLLELQTSYSIIHTYRDTIQTGMFADEHEICVQDLDEAHLILGNPANFEGREFYRPFMDFCNVAHEHNINLSYPIGGFYESMQKFVDTPSQPSRFFSVDPHGKDTRCEGRYLVAYQKGYYGEFGDLPQKLLAYAKAHALAFYGPLYVVYLLDEVSIAEPEQYLAQVVVGVVKKA